VVAGWTMSEPASSRDELDLVHATMFPSSVRR
jgi:hypothetical protein